MRERKTTTTAHKVQALISAAAMSFLFFAGSASIAGDAPPSGIAGLSHDEALRLGQKMYREGILPSGRPMSAMVQGDIPVEGRTLTCTNCHLRSGYGTSEGTIRTSPIDGTRLYSPVAAFKRIPVRRGAVAPPAPNELARPAYTDETLARVMNTGVDPSGRQLAATMPIYSLDDRDMSILVYYLKNLSVGLQPGVTETTLRFATVVTDDVPSADREAMLRPLQSFIANWRVSRNMERMSRSDAFLQEGISRPMRTLSLAVWELKGPSAGWRAQLEEHYRKDPAFALLGGITTKDWEPIHRFCEDHEIPAVFPVTDFPVLSENDWYTLYLSKGLAQEGEAAARYLHSRDDGMKNIPVVQVFRNERSGLALSKSFGETWTGLGHPAPENLAVDSKEKLTGTFWKNLAKKHKHAIVLLWLRGEDFPGLDDLTKAQVRPDMVFASSTLLGRRLYALPEKERAAVYLTYPYALPAGPPTGAPAPAAQQPAEPSALDSGIELKMRSLAATITGPLVMMRSFVYRDYFLEVIESSPDLAMPSIGYLRLSFGTGQRYASKGCYIVQLSEGKAPRLIPRSDWVIH